MSMREEEFSVTVVMPAYNAESYIGEAIRSVLNQTLAPRELIVVDDGSTDATRSVVEAFPEVTYFHQPNAGVAAALNAGCRHARGSHLAFISADDVWCADKLEIQCREIRKAPDALVFGHMQNFISPDVPPEAASKLVCPPDPMPAYSAGTLLAGVGTFSRVGRFNERFAVGEFMDWYGRSRELGIRSVMLGNVLSNRRVHRHNHSKAVLARKSYAPVLKALLDRRRTGGQGA